jgi:uncharacterized protein
MVTAVERADPDQGPPEPALPRPVSPSERVLSLDVLRGFALLGILIINIQSFSMIEAAYLNPTATGDLTGANLYVWFFSYLLADQKMMTIFSMLFGAGIFLMADRAKSRGLPSAGRHYLRMFWLILFGMLHAHLLWYGDILYVYGMCGVVVYLFRNLSPRWLIPLGLLSLAVCSALWLLMGLSMPAWPEPALADFREDWHPEPEMIEAELAAMRGGWMDQMGQRIPAALFLETVVFLIWGSWRAGGLMLIGIGLYKLGVFSAARSTRTYVGLLAFGIFIGIPTVLIGVYRNFEAGWDVTYSFFLGWQYNYWGSVAVSLGWVGLVMILLKRSGGGWLTRSLAAVGRMALTNYFLHTLICTTLFYGHGFGLFGRVDRLGQIVIVVAIWVLQLVISPLWLDRFRFGPVEWLWRTLTYLQVQPFRR